MSDFEGLKNFDDVRQALKKVPLPGYYRQAGQFTLIPAENNPCEISIYGSPPNTWVTSVAYTALPEYNGELFSLRTPSASGTQRLTKEGFLEEEDREEPFPRYAWEWSSGLRNSQNKGQLSWVRVDLEADATITYSLAGIPYLKAGRRFNTSSKIYPRRMRALEEQYALMPESLEGQTELLDRNITWRIDYDQKAKGVIEASRIADILQAIRDS